MLDALTRLLLWNCGRGRRDEVVVEPAFRVVCCSAGTEVIDIMVGSLGIYEDHRLRGNFGAVPLDFLHGLAGKRHGGYGIIACCFFDDGINVGYCFFFEGGVPDVFDGGVVAFDILVGAILEDLTFRCGEGADAGCEGTRNCFEAARDKREADGGDFDASEFRFLVFEDRGADAGFISAYFDHLTDFVEEEVKISIASISEFLGAFVLLVVGEVAEYWDVVLVIF